MLPLQCAIVVIERCGPPPLRLLYEGQTAICDNAISAFCIWPQFYHVQSGICWSAFNWTGFVTRRWSLLFAPCVHASGVYLSAPIMSYGSVLFSVSNLFKKLWSTVILSHVNAIKLQLLSLKVGKSLKIRKNRIKSEKSDSIFYQTFGKKKYLISGDVLNAE